MSHNKDELLAVQDFRVKKMSHPSHVTTYIKEQQRIASTGVRGRRPDEALLSFYASMEHLCSTAGSLLDYISLSAVITAIAQLSPSAPAKSGFKPSANSAAFELKRFWGVLLLQLEPMTSAVGAREISNILWSSAKLGLHPDAFVPGMTDALAAKVLQLTRGEGRRQPSAQRCANSLWALATLGHHPADKGLIDAVCNHFAMLIKHHDKSKQPNAKNAANVVWAVATLGHEPANKGLVDAVCNHFAMLIEHHDKNKRPNAQAAAMVMWAVATLGHEPADKGLADVVCNHFAMLIKHHDESKRPNAQTAAIVVWAVATMGHDPADKGLVDAVCKHFAMLTKHHDVFKRPSAQGAANVMWALGKMNHAPSDSVASDILERFMVLCGLPRQAPNAQELSNTLYACAMLRLKVKDHVRLALVDGLLRIDRSCGYKQHYCNAAWSLAVSGVLSSEMFLALLERLQPLPTAEPTHVALTRQGLFQLYQALDFLHPLPMAAAQQLQGMVTRLGPGPLPKERSAADLSASEDLCAVLEQLRVAFTANVPLSGYQAAAVLQPRDDVTVPVVLVTKAFDHFRNQHWSCAFSLCSLYITAMYG